MVVAKVIGEVVSTVKVDRLSGQKFLLVEVQKISSGKRGVHVESTGSTLVANDLLGAGRGEIVLVVQGSSARMTDATGKLPTDGLIIGIVDSITVDDVALSRKDM